MSGQYLVDGILNSLTRTITNWREEKGFTTSWHNVPEKLMLIVTELSEAMEAYRKLPAEALRSLEQGNLLPGPRGDEGTERLSEIVDNFQEELADTAIRLFDLTAALGIDLEHEIDRKMQKNEERPHKHGKEL